MDHYKCKQDPTRGIVRNNLVKTSIHQSEQSDPVSAIRYYCEQITPKHNSLKLPFCSAHYFVDQEFGDGSAGPGVSPVLAPTCQLAHPTRVGR